MGWRSFLVGFSGGRMNTEKKFEKNVDVGINPVYPFSRRCEQADGNDMKTQHERIKPKLHNSVFYKSDNGWEDFGYVTEVEPSGIVHVEKLNGGHDSFIWIFKQGTKNEHTNGLFKWGVETAEIPK